MWKFLVFLTGLGGAFWSGCVPAEQHRDLEFKTQKLETDLAACQTALRAEEARAAALSERLQNEERSHAATRAEMHLHRGRAAELQRQYDALREVIEKRAQRPPERPSVPASPLPQEVDEALVRLAEKYGQRIWYDRGRGALSLANDRLFEPGSDVVQVDAQPILRELAGIAARALPEQFDVVVVGHTDDTAITKEETRARHPTNWHLSVHRAIAVKDVLVGAGLPSERVAVMGYGASRPVSQDRTQNRRVEIFLVRQGEVQSFAPVRPSR